MKKIFLMLIAAYKIVLSPIVGGQCRFYPSCSDYAAGAFAKHSLWSATKLSLKRFLRCSPLYPGGIDMVP